ncbi:MAG TPA: 50S ribosomal protein L6, partial [Candidatus Nanoarchaeia archaeon]|nr:50S ribosomal protein L6 [Candidatus Nanoarchaeia archaeon]
MNVSVSGNEFNVANFLGEKTPRKLKIKDGVKVKVEGEFVVVEGIRKEDAGQVAANIEILTKVKGRDRRIFQDGIYIIEKDGKQMG